MSPSRKFIITTGDTDGIGLEVTYKALLLLSPPKGVSLSVYEPIKIHPSLRALRKKVLKKYSPAKLNMISSRASPAKWVFEAATLCRNNTFAAMITAPISKTLIRNAGYSHIGHTEILAAVSRAPSLNMGFAGKNFNVVLATGHLPVREVSRALTTELLVSAAENADGFRRRLPRRQRRRPLALVGLNPHAGESGLIGSEERRVFRSAIRILKRKKIPIVGPLVPDAAFLRQNWRKYSVFVCPYHDQGLIPFKLVHGADSGAHITLGLPFVRTSVDHGTAKDIFGKGRANPHSMLDAIRWAIRLSDKK